MPSCMPMREGNKLISQPWLSPSLSLWLSVWLSRCLPCLSICACVSTSVSSFVCDSFAPMYRLWLFICQCLCVRDVGVPLALHAWGVCYLAYLCVCLIIYAASFSTLSLCTLPCLFESPLLLSRDSSILFAKHILSLLILIAQHRIALGTHASTTPAALRPAVTTTTARQAFGVWGKWSERRGQ